MPPRRRIPATVRRRVAEQAGHRCSYCRSPEVVGIPVVAGHIITLSAGGTSHIGNLGLACYRCNEFKGARLGAPDLLSGEIVALFNLRAQAWHDHFSVVLTVRAQPPSEDCGGCLYLGWLLKSWVLVHCFLQYPMANQCTVDLTRWLGTNLVKNLTSAMGALRADGVEHKRWSVPSQ